MIKIDVLIYSSPKGGGNTIQKTLLNLNIPTYYTHNKYFFKNDDLHCQKNKIDLEDYINYQIKTYPNRRLKILFSYREIFEQKISYFFQNYGSGIFPELYNKNIYEFINYFNNYILNCDEDTNNFFELFTNLKIQDFIKKEFYYYFKHTNIDFYIVRFRDLNNIDNILKNILNLKVKPLIVNSNDTVNKSYYDIYKQFQDKYYLPIYVYNKVKSNNNLMLNFLLDINEKIEYFKKWEQKIDLDKTLILKNSKLILQNDTNLGFYKYITNNIKLPNRINSFSNYLMLIYPDKHFYLQKYFPNYLQSKINELNNIDSEQIYFDPNLLDETDFYSYDTHINLKGSTKLFKNFINKINSKFNKNYQVEFNLINNEINPYQMMGYGDLLWTNNISKDKITSIKITNEFKYTFKNKPNMYMEPLEFVKSIHKNIMLIPFKETYKTNLHMFGWENISNNIIININEKIKQKDTVLIFYDIFTLELLPLILDTFYKVILVKTNFNKILCNRYKPDIILELRVLRFLT